MLSSRILPVGLVCLVILSCGKEKPVETVESNPAENKLVIYNWEEYLGSDTVEEFTRQTGIEVIEIYYEEEEEMVGAVQANPHTYDVVVASDDAVREMIQASMIMPIDYGKIPNFRHINPEFLHRTWDPDQKYSVPYLWGTTGVVVNTAYISNHGESVGVLFDERYEGRIGMLTDPWEIAATAAKHFGQSINSPDEDEWVAVTDLMLEQSAFLHGYYNELELQDLLLDGTIWAAQIYSGAGLIVVDEGDDFVYYIPVEGAAQWLDLFVIPENAPHPEAAHQFLDFVLTPEINAAIASEYWYATANAAAEEFMDGEVLDDTAVYPTDEIRSRLEFFTDVGNADRVVNRAWAEIELGE